MPRETAAEAAEEFQSIRARAKSGVPSGLQKMAHDVDPKQVILNQVGDLSAWRLNAGQVLVGTYIRPDKTASGIYITAKQQMEDVYQGAVGLVLKVGPGCFVDDPANGAQFFDFKAEVGEWVVYRAGDGLGKYIGPQHCRIVQDTLIKGVIPEPDTVL